MQDRIAEIRSRLEGVKGKEWVYDPKHEMFVGTTNMLVMYERNVDLGRNAVEYKPSIDPETGRTVYKMADWCEGHNQRLHALGEFLQQCREDMAYLLSQLEPKQ